jgi:hypothetical protein
MCERGSGEAVVDIAAWLQRLGLEQYEQAFRGNDIDAEVLPELTAEDLVGLGVTSIGHRRKLLAAIAALRDIPADENGASATSPEDRDREAALRGRARGRWADGAGRTVGELALTGRRVGA